MMVPLFSPAARVLESCYGLPFRPLRVAALLLVAGAGALFVIRRTMELPAGDSERWSTSSTAMSLALGLPLSIVPLVLYTFAAFGTNTRVMLVAVMVSVVVGLLPPLRRELIARIRPGGWYRRVVHIAALAVLGGAELTLLFESTIAALGGPNGVDGLLGCP